MDVLGNLDRVLPQSAGNLTTGISAIVGKMATLLTAVDWHLGYSTFSPVVCCSESLFRSASRGGRVFISFYSNFNFRTFLETHLIAVFVRQ